jgi:DegV family protein with EDD domain
MQGSAPVVIVTDSTAYLPIPVIRHHRLTVVPLHVVLRGRSLAEGLDVDSADVAAALTRGEPVTTSRPPPQVFAETYRRLRAEGAGAVVSVHLSGDLSGTVEAARIAAESVADHVDVRVVDSRSLGMGLGFTAIETARVAAAGAPVDEVVEVAMRRAESTSVWFYVDTLEFLRRGGRIGAAQATVGSALAIKPLLTVRDGRLEPVDRVRTRSRALARLEEIVVSHAGEETVQVAIHHLAGAEAAEALAERLRGRLTVRGAVSVSEVGAVVGAHVGPGMLGVVVTPGDGGETGSR